MATIGREAARAPLTSADINDGIVTAADLASTLDLSSKTLTLGAVSSTGNLTFGDNDKAVFGAGSDLQIYHTGSVSVIADEGTGNLLIRGSDLRLQNAAGSNNYLKATDGAEVELMHGGATKLATTNTGIDVTGTVTADGLTVEGTGDLGTIGNGAFNQAAALGFQGDRAYFGYSSSQNTLIQSGASKGVVIEVNNDTLDSGTRAALFASNGDISFYEDNGTTAKFFWDASAERLGIGTSSPTHNLTVGDANAETTIGVAGNRSQFGFKSDLAVVQGGSGKGIQFNVDNNTFGSGEAMRITSGGNVGIGNSSPSSLFQVGVPLTATAGIRVSGSWLNIDAGYQSAGVNGTAAAPCLIIGGDADTGFFHPASDTLAISTLGNERLRITSAGRVGIGTSSPSVELDVNGAYQGAGNIITSSGIIRSPDGSAATPSIQPGVDGDTGFFRPTTNTIGFSTAGSEAMRIDSSGNLLVGRSSAFSSSRVEIQSAGSGGTGASECLTLNNTGANGNMLELYNSGALVGAITASTNSDIAIGSGNCGIRFDDTNQALKPWDITNNNVETGSPIDIGTDGARFGNLYLSNTAYITAPSTSTAVLQLENTDASVVAGQSLGNITWRANDVSAGGTGIRGRIGCEAENAGTNYALTFATGQTAAATEKMRIDASGNVGIGTSSPKTIINASTSTGAILTLESSDTSLTTNDVIGGIDFYANDGSTNGTGAKVNIRGIATSTAGTITALTFGTSDSSSATATERMRIDGSGNLLVGTTSAPESSGGGAGFVASTSSRRILQLATTSTSSNTLQTFNNPNGTVGSVVTSGSATSFNTSSDQRLKENIVDAPSASDDIDAIQVRSFDWKVDGSHQRYGMVAQELLEVAPEAVSQGETEEDMMGVDYSKLVPMLVKEIQSLRARVAQLEGA